jgi:hypothetical protein
MDVLVMLPRKLISDFGEADKPGITNLINIHNKISEDLVNEILIKSVENLRYFNLINKIQKIFSQEKQPFSVKMLKIGKYNISPIYDLNITRQSKILYKSIQRQSTTKKLHSYFMDSIDFPRRIHLKTRVTFQS